MRDFYLWTGLVVVGVSACVLIVRIVSRLFDRQRERRYVPPSVLYTEVRESIHPSVQALSPAAFTELLTTVDIRMADVGAPSSWALSALSDVRKTASEDTYATLGEFAGRTHATVIPIWAELDGIFTARGLVTA